MHVRTALWAISLLPIGWYSPEARPQSCEAPLPIFVGFVDQRSSCGTDHLPAENVGTIDARGGDVVYDLPIGATGYFAFLLSQEPLLLFVCHEPCSPASTCVAAGSTAESGNVALALPNDGGHYYVIVDSVPGFCGDYTLNFYGPLDLPSN